MPIKFPKGFTRRKSSGNVLDEVENPPEPSFKVFERPGGGSRSFDGANALKRMTQGRPLSSPEDLADEDDNLFSEMKKTQPKYRGSGGTNNSASTGGLYDSSASSARFSSSSTLPSSTDVPVHNESTFSLKRVMKDKPVPPIPESQPTSLRARAGRTFSFGNKGVKSSPTTASATEPASHTESPPVRGVTRERAMTASTASTASTATPPKLLDSDLSFDSDEGFGNMFDSLNRTTPPVGNPGYVSRNTSSPDFGSSPLPPLPPKHGLSPITVDHARPIEPSPYSWNSQNSQNSRQGLISSPSPPPAPSSAEKPAIPRKSLPASRSMPLSNPSSLTESQPGRPGFGVRNTSGFSRRSSTPIEDEDARLVQDSILTGRPPAFQPRPTPQRNRAQAEIFDGDDGDIAGSAAWHDESMEQTPKPKKSLPDRTGETSAGFDSSLAAHAQLASRFEEKESNPPKPTNKIMTPAQFERYRQQRELSRTKSNASESDASDADSENYSDDDETERNRQAAKQRKVQEAHLAVYRQQMMKVTGEQGSDLPQGASRASMSTPNLLPSRMSTLGVGSEKGDVGKTSDEEDEDVPLGILAAHGFPNKNRPPTRMSGAASATNARIASQYGAPSAVGESTAGGPRGSLPVFARNLPQDPYFGSSLVNPPNRESLAMSGGSPAGPAGPPPGVPPGGLVGVIAGEERARAMRRGSPNAQAGYEMPRSQTMGNMSQMGPMGMPMPGMLGMPPQPQMLSPGDQAQIQMSQQMTQMMNMQMQWMQQMMQMQTGQMSPQQQQPPTGMNGFLAAPGQMQRPMSMNSNQPPQIPTPQQDQRTLSLLDPNRMAQWKRSSTFSPSINGMQQGPGYAHSIAPSERSNVGMASRYRPVSTAVPAANKNAYNRASTFTSSSMSMWNQQKPSPSPPLPKSQSSSTIKAVDQAKTPSKMNAGSDDDDDEGWADMKKKRDRKTSMWKTKKGQNALQDVFHGAP